MKEHFATRQEQQKDIDGVFPASLEHCFNKTGQHLMEQVSPGYYRSIMFTNGTERVSSGQARQWKSDRFVLVGTTLRGLKGLTNPKSANKAGNKQTINLALFCLCLVRFFSFRFTGE